MIVILTLNKYVNTNYIMFYDILDMPHSISRNIWKLNWIIFYGTWLEIFL